MICPLQIQGENKQTASENRLCVPSQCYAFLLLLVEQAEKLTRGGQHRTHRGSDTTAEARLVRGGEDKNEVADQPEQDQIASISGMLNKGATDTHGGGKTKHTTKKTRAQFAENRTKKHRNLPKS
jgi:hypothetical protein